MTSQEIAADSMAEGCTCETDRGLLTGKLKYYGVKMLSITWPHNKLLVGGLNTKLLDSQELPIRHVTNDIGPYSANCMHDRETIMMWAAQLCNY